MSVINYFRTHPWGLGAAAVIITGMAWLAFGFFGVHTLFFDDEVSEALPSFDATPPAEPDVSDSPLAEDDSADPADPADVQPPSSSAPVESLPAPQSEPAATTSTSPPAVAAEIVTEYSGSFESGAHPTSGTAVVLGNGTSQRFLRFEEFSTDNGPDLNVYLVNSSTGDVSDFVDLGDLKGNIGEQNYEIPPDIDLGVYDEVVIWCVRFGVGFGDATLELV
jgi:hypothetical protein